MTAISTPRFRFDLAQHRREWFANPRRDVLAGVVVALALIPEAIAFSIIAGVDPQVGLYALFIIAIVTAFIGGRPGMISAATGAMALLMIGLVRDRQGTPAGLIGLGEASATLIDRLAVYDKPGALERSAGH